jgi:hypothetical protein
MGEADYIIGPESVEEPPQAPSIRRRIRLTPSRGVFISICFLVIISALTGVFGESRREIRQQRVAIEMVVEYPTRNRYRQINTIRISVQNRSGQAMDTLTIALDPDYARQFSDVKGIPSFSEGWEMNLTNVAPGERRRMVMELTAEHFGIHRGEISAFARGMDTLSVEVETIIFP